MILTKIGHIFGFPVIRDWDTLLNPLLKKFRPLQLSVCQQDKILL